MQGARHAGGALRVLCCASPPRLLPPPLLVAQVPAPGAPEFLSYYLLLSRGTFGSFRASTPNVVRLLNSLGPDALVRQQEGRQDRATDGAAAVVLAACARCSRRAGC